MQVTHVELQEFLSSQQEGPIVYIPESHSPRKWAKFLQLKAEDKLKHLKTMVDSHQQEKEEEEKQKSTWSWRKLLDSVFAKKDKKTKDYKGKGRSPDSYNLYDAKADFKNRYGWSIALDASSYSPLRKSGFGVYLDNLTAVTQLIKLIFKLGF